MPKRSTAAKTSKARGVLNIGIDPDTNRLINAACDRYNTKKGPLVASIIRWVLTSPESVQNVIMSVAPADMKQEYLRKILQFFSNQLGADETPLKLAADERHPDKPGH